MMNPTVARNVSEIRRAHRDQRPVFYDYNKSAALRIGDGQPVCTLLDNPKMEIQAQVPLNVASWNAIGLKRNAGLNLRGLPWRSGKN